MPRSSLPLLLCQCAILSAALEGIVCPVVEFNFVIDNFGTADIYKRVIFDGSNQTGDFIFEKEYTEDGGRQHVIRVPDILDETLKQEENCPKIVSFSVKGVNANYNIKFKNAKQAELFAIHKAMPSHFKMVWARIYSNWRPAIMAYDVLEDGDLGFKVVDNDGNYPDIDYRLEKMTYLFRHSDIKREIKTRPPHTLYLRNETNKEDYEIMFRSRDDLGTFLDFFPERKYNEYKTQGYYFIPHAHEIHAHRHEPHADSEEPHAHDRNKPE